MDSSPYLVQKKMEAIWHVYSDGTRADIPFDADEDKVYAWNSIAISAKIAGVRVLVATVNDTHLHSLVLGEEDRAERFRRIQQQRLSTHYQDIYLACNLVPTRDDALSKFMYVYRNCLDFYQKLPGEYPWGSGHIYFSEKKHFNQGRLIGNLSLREQQRMFNTREPLPADWRYDADGRILPESFIDYAYAEELFRTVRAFIAFQYVRKEDEAKMKQEIHRRYLESRTIQDLRRIGNRHSNSYCGRTLAKASLGIRLKVATRMLRDGDSGRSPTLAKALYLKPDDLRLLT